MAGELFTPVKFELPKKEEEAPLHPTQEDTTFPELEAFHPVLEKIRLEMTKVEAGTSKLHRSPMYFPKGINPASNTLAVFEKDPSEKVLCSFIDIVKQDYGSSVKDQFVDWIKEVYPRLPRRKANE